MDRHDWDARYRTSDLVWAERPNRWVEREAADLAPARALDLACGEGRNAVWLAGRGWEVRAVDWSEVAIGKARQLAAHFDVTVEWIVADLMSYEPEPQAYDLVLLSYLQVPAADRAAIWPLAAAAVAPGGTFLLVGHDRSNLEHGWGGPSSPSVLYSPADVLPVLDGFEIELAEVVQRPVELDDGSVTHALDALVRGRRPS